MYTVKDNDGAQLVRGCYRTVSRTSPAWDWTGDLKHGTNRLAQPTSALTNWAMSISTKNGWSQPRDYHTAGKTSLFHMRGVDFMHFNTCCTPLKVKVHWWPPFSWGHFNKHNGLSDRASDHRPMLFVHSRNGPTPGQMAAVYWNRPQGVFH